MNALFEYLCTGVDAAQKFYDSILLICPAGSFKEAVFEQFAILLQRHQILAVNSSGFKKSLLPECLVRGITLYPENTLLLNMFVTSQRQSRIENRVSLTLDKLCRT
jgi:hypothetical protein